MATIDTTSGEFDYTYLSLGAGVQSSALLVLACEDDRVPKPDVAIFADTGDEPPWVYEYLEVLTEYAAGHGVPVEVAKERKPLSEDATRLVPFFTRGEGGNPTGMLVRGCTREYKIRPIQRKVRALLGYKPRQSIRERVRCMMGISIDEAIRMKASPVPWATNAYPLVDLGITRHACVDIVVAAGLPKPVKSACVFCPYHSDAYWQFLKDEHPDQFERAVQLDASSRTMENVRQETFLHRSLVPLDQAEFNAGDPHQGDLFAEECEGMCGI